MNRMKQIGIAAALALLPTVASATGGVGCSINDANMDFGFEALFGYGSDSPLFQVQAQIDVKSDKVPPSLKKVEMDGTYLKQQWFEGKDIKLLLFAETKEGAAPYGSVKLVVEAVQADDDELSYPGSYVLTLQNGPSDEHEPVVLKGKIECSAG